MAIEDKIDIDIFKLWTHVITRSNGLDEITNQLAQLIVSALGIKGSTIFVLNQKTEELEALTSFGLSINYVNKGPVMSYESIGWSSKKEPVVINDVSKTDLLQYPEDAKKEGISAIINIPIKFRGNIIGALRLYHHDSWEISDRDVDSLNKLAEIFGIALMHTRVENALQSINDTVKDVHTIWLSP